MNCSFCARLCNVDRVAGEQGYCGVGTAATVASVLPHHGEEPPICGPGGAGTVFFSGCNLRCRFCQNWQISRDPASGEETGVQELARHYSRLSGLGCSHIDLVSPTPHLPWAMQAVDLARDEHGLDIPVVVNSNGYLPVKTVDYYARYCEIMLIDFKLIDEGACRVLLDAPDYGSVALRAVERAAELFGPLEVDDDGLALRGTIVRHLVLPGLLEDTRRIMSHLAPLGVTVSLMSQYHPSGEDARALPWGLSAPLSEDEYHLALEAAGRAGVDSIIIQEPGCGSAFLPDFRASRPFGSD